MLHAVAFVLSVTSILTAADASPPLPVHSAALTDSPDRVSTAANDASRLGPSATRRTAQWHSNDRLETPAARMFVERVHQELNYSTSYTPTFGKDFVGATG